VSQHHSTYEQYDYNNDEDYIFTAGKDDTSGNFYLDIDTSNTDLVGELLEIYLYALVADDSYVKAYDSKIYVFVSACGDEELSADPTVASY